MVNDFFIVLGSTGMLGQALTSVLREDNKTVVGIARSNTDICLDATNDDELLKTISTLNPSVIINTIAIVDLKYCQNNPSICYLINARISSVLSNYCKKRKIKYIYISTDHYFATGVNKQHNEVADINLCNEYAISKYLGEKLTLTNKDALVIRTNIVGFRGNKDQLTFVEWVILSLNNKDKIILFDDVFTSSIDVRSFVKSLLILINKDTSGVINLASSEVFSKVEFVTLLATKFNLSLVNASIGSSYKKNPIINRNNSLGLDVSKAQQILNYSLPTLEQVVNNLHNEYLKH